MSRVQSSLWACVTEKVLMMSVQMSDDWSKAPHTDVTRDFNCDQELLSPHSSVSVIRGNGGAAQNYRESLETLAWTEKWPRSIESQEDKRQSLAAVVIVC